MREHMERLKDYCFNVCMIDSLQTFIISPAKYDAFIKDSNLLNDLQITKARYEAVLSYAKIVGEVGTDKLYPAFVYLPFFAERFQWLPLYCYKNKNQFYHVNYRNTWMCRECGNVMNKSILMPMAEADATIYPRDKRPCIPPIFQKMPCPKCGKLLQNHLVIIE